MSSVSRRDFLARSSLGLIAAAAWPSRAHAALARRHEEGLPDPAWEEVDRILARIRPPTFADREYRLPSFGARGDGRSDAREAFARAIDRCAAEGGGRVVVPPGTWWVEGPIHLKSNVHLVVEEGATIRFTPDPARYLPMVLTRWEGTELFNYSPLIYAYQAHNVAITGRGTIDGNSKETFATWKPSQTEAQLRLRQMGSDRVPVHQRVFGEGHWLRPSMIQLYGCRNVQVEGVTILDSPFWILHPVHCQNVIARDLRMDSWNHNNDGVDPDSTSDVLIERCTFNTGDDGVAVKSGRDADGWRVGQPSENIVVRDCRMNSKANGLVIGSEMSGGARNVFMENCRIGTVENTAIYFKSNLDRGGTVERIRIRNVTVEDARKYFIHFTTDYHGYRGGNAPTTFRDIALENITCEKAGVGIYVVGAPTAPLRDVRLTDVHVRQAEVPYRIRHVEDLRLEEVYANGAPVTPAAAGA